MVPDIMVMSGDILGASVILVFDVLEGRVELGPLVVEDVKEESDESQHDQSPEDIGLVRFYISAGSVEAVTEAIVGNLDLTTDVVCHALAPADCLLGRLAPLQNESLDLGWDFTGLLDQTARLALDGRDWSTEHGRSFRGLDTAAGRRSAGRTLNDRSLSGSFGLCLGLLRTDRPLRGLGRTTTAHRPLLWLRLWRLDLSVATRGLRDALASFGLGSPSLRLRSRLRL